MTETARNVAHDVAGVIRDIVPASPLSTEERLAACERELVRLRRQLGELGASHAHALDREDDDA